MSVRYGGEKTMIIPQSVLRCGLLGSAIAVGLCSSAQAAIYGSIVGATTTYQNISETDSQIAGPPPVNSTPTALFGAPVILPSNSDNLTFPTISFSALVADGQFELQDGKLNFDAVPNSPTITLHSLSFDEGGGWRVDGLTGDASSEATLLFDDVRITSVNGVALANPIIVTPTFTESITTQNGSAQTVQGTGQDTITSTGGDADGTWDITASFNLDQALSIANLTGNVTGVSVALDNQLLAQTTVPDSGLTLAEIDKKHFIVSDVTTTGPTVPEPASMWMLLGAGLMLMMRSPYRAVTRRRATA
jgi:hypothetical protein